MEAAHEASSLVVPRHDPLGQGHPLGRTSPLDADLVHLTARSGSRSVRSPASSKTTPRSTSCATARTGPTARTPTITVMQQRQRLGGRGERHLPRRRRPRTHGRDPRRQHLPASSPRARRSSPLRSYLARRPPASPSIAEIGSEPNPAEFLDIAPRADSRVGAGARTVGSRSAPSNSATRTAAAAARGATTCRAGFGRTRRPSPARRSSPATGVTHRVVSRTRDTFKGRRTRRHRLARRQVAALSSIPASCTPSPSPTASTRSPANRRPLAVGFRPQRHRLASPQPCRRRTRRQVPAIHLVHRRRHPQPETMVRPRRGADVTVERGCRLGRRAIKGRGGFRGITDGGVDCPVTVSNPAGAPPLDTWTEPPRHLDHHHPTLTPRPLRHVATTARRTTHPVDVPRVGVHGVRGTTTAADADRTVR